MNQGNRCYVVEWTKRKGKASQKKKRNVGNMRKGIGTRKGTGKWQMQGKQCAIKAMCKERNEVVKRKRKSHKR